MSTFGSRVRQRRLELGMSQAELSVKLGYKSRASVNKLESDERNLNQDQLVDLAKVLRVTPSWLLGIDEDLHISIIDIVNKPSLMPLKISYVYLTGELGYLVSDSSLTDFGFRPNDLLIFGNSIHEQQSIFDLISFPSICLIKTKDDYIVRKVYDQSETKYLLIAGTDAIKPKLVSKTDIKVIGSLCNMIRQYGFK